jgi:hypothetical protein
MKNIIRVRERERERERDFIISHELYYSQTIPLLFNIFRK